MTVASGGPSARGGVRAGYPDTDVLLGMDMNGPVYLQSGGDLIIAIDDQPVKTFDDLLIYLESLQVAGRTGDADRAALDAASTQAAASRWASVRARRRELGHA